MAHRDAPTPRDSHGHSHGSHGLRDMLGSRRRVLLIVMLVGLVVTGIEVAAGIAANSLVLLADAAHYATDLLGLLLAFAAVTLASRPVSFTKTFGWQRAEVVAAFLNALALWGLSIYLVFEAYERLLAPPEVHGVIVVAVGAFTLVANAGMAWVLHRSGGGNLNMRAAFLHVLGDALGSAGALLAGLLVAGFGWNIADPLLTLFVTVLIVVFTWRLTSQTLHILLEGTPEHLDVREIVESLRDIENVSDVHDLHVWSLTSGVESLSVHVVIEEGAPSERVVHAVHERLVERFHIRHATVQVEGPGPCPSHPCTPGG